MGVNLLCKFIENDLPNGRINVNILAVIQEYQRTHRKLPLIVVDLKNFRSLWQPKQEILCGFRAKQYCDRVRCFFKKLKDAGTEIVFFEDGPTQSDKEFTWVLRRNQDYDNELDVIDAIRVGKSVDWIVAEKKVKPSVMVNGLFKSVVQEFGRVHWVMDVECDLKLAAYATENNALAVFTNDTDFMIYRGEWRFWSIKDLNEEQMTTMEYNRKELRRYFHVSEEQLVLIATLAGNDILKSDATYHFLKRLSWKFGGKYNSKALAKFSNIAEFVRTWQSSDLYELAELIDNRNMEKVAGLIKKSIASYSFDQIKEVKKKEESEEDPSLAKYQNHFNYDMLKGFPFRLKLFFEDFRDSNKQYTKLVWGIIQRKMGIILKHRQDSTRKIYFKPSHAEGFQVGEIKPIFPARTVPNLDSLLSEDVGLDKTRMEFLAWIFKNSFDPINLFRLEKQFIPLLAALAFLVQEADFNVDDADIFLCAFYDVYDVNDRVPVDECVPKFLDHKAFVQTFAVLNFYFQVDECLKCLNLGHYVVPTIFDGVHYHQLQQQWKLMDKKKKEKKLEEVKRFRDIYCK